MLHLVTRESHPTNMKKRRYFKIRTRENDPRVILRKENHHTGYTFDHSQKSGEFYRVHPTNHDFEQLLMMKHRVDKFAPAIGNGIIIRADVLKAIDAMD